MHITFMEPTRQHRVRNPDVGRARKSVEIARFITLSCFPISGFLPRWTIHVAKSYILNRRKSSRIFNTTQIELTTMPSHANTIPLDRVAALSTGLAARYLRQVTDRGNKDLRQLITLKDLQDEGHGPLGKTATVELDAAIARRFSLCVGDILVAGRGTTLKIAQVGEADQGAVAETNLFVIRPRAEVVRPDYLYEVLITARMRHTLQTCSTARATGLFLRLQDLAAIEVPWVPLETQEKLTELLAVSREQSELLREAALVQRQLGEAIAWNKLGEVS